MHVEFHYKGLDAHTLSLHGMGLKEVLLHCLGQVDFPSAEVSFDSHLPSGKGTFYQAHHLRAKLLKEETGT